MKKGFTLIELLAVIVILAIIAIIAVPIVLNIINDAKESSLLRSAEFYLDAAEYAIADAFLYHGGLEDDTYPITPEGDICTKELPCDLDHTLKVEVSGDKPTSGYLKLKSGVIEETELIINKKMIIFDGEKQLKQTDKVCKLTVDNNSNKQLDYGDVVNCGNQAFYVMPNHEKTSSGTVSLISMYLLNVGDNKYPNEITYGIQDKNVDGESYGGVKFSNLEYWAGSNCTISNNYLTDFVYDKNSTMYAYVEEYKNYLINLGLSENITVTVPSKNQFYNFTEIYIISRDMVFWLGSATDCEYVEFVDTFFCESSCILEGIGYASQTRGIRPVLIIEKSKIRI